MRDSNYNIIKVICDPLGGCDSMKVEVFGLLMGLREFKRMGIKHCTVEGDSAMIVSWSMGKGVGSSNLIHFIYEMEVGSGGDLLVHLA